MNDLNEVLGNPADDPAEVANHIVRALRDDEFECILGRRERLFARLNALLPRLVDVALLQKLATIRDFAQSLARQAAARGSIDPDDDYVMIL